MVPVEETAQQNTADVNRNIKDSVFTDLFKDKANILKMYKELHPEDAAVTVEDNANNANSCNSE